MDVTERFMTFFISKSCHPKVYEQKYAAKYKLEICEISDKVLFFMINYHNDNEAKFERWYKYI